MRTITHTVYKYDELSDTAKESARDNWGHADSEYHWWSDAKASLDAFCTEFCVEVKDYEFGAFCHSFCTLAETQTWYDDNAFHELRYVRLWKYMENNYDLDRLLSGNCPLTGYCADESLLDKLREFRARPWDVSYDELMQECVDKWVKDTQSDAEWQYSDECVEESIRCNECDFYEDGTIA